MITNNTKDIKILACDFDDTLAKSVTFPKIGGPNIKVIETVKKLKSQGWYIILWTCRDDESLDAAVQWCKKYGLVFDCINDNAPWIKEEFGNNTRKIFAHVYLDDKAMNVSEIIKD